MAAFLVFAAVLVACAIAFAGWPLWRGARPLALGLALALPVTAAALYMMLGAPAALDPAKLVPEERTPTMEEAIAKLEQHLAQDPGDLEGTVLLARSYMALERFDRAPALFARAVALAPDDVDLSVDYAEALLRASPDRTFPPEAVARLERALERNPTQQRALFFLGLHRMQQGQPAEATKLWERLLPLLDPDAAASLRVQVDRAREAAGLAPLPAPAAPAAAPGIDVTVSIAPGLAAGLPADAVLYVFARTPDGGGPPLAAKRIAPATLPQQFRLTDADSPMPAAKLSSVEQVVLVARISMHGDVAAVSGDIQSAPATVATAGTAPVALVLDQVVP
jgi:cytochrome c-type biogenesis protein CcmH